MGLTITTYRVAHWRGDNVEEISNFCNLSNLRVSGRNPNKIINIPTMDGTLNMRPGDVLLMDENGNMSYMTRDEISTSTTKIQPFTNYNQPIHDSPITIRRD